MDALAFRLANALVGNEESAAGLEVTLSGEHILYTTYHATSCCLTTHRLPSSTSFCNAMQAARHVL